MSGVFMRQGKGLLRLKEMPYEAETVLQELLEQHPEVLAGDDDHHTWLLVRREANIGLGQGSELRGSLDHLFLDSDGVPTLVEVKRSSDSRIRREVVGQMLDYAANAATRWSAETLQAWHSERCHEENVDPDQALRSAFPEIESIPEFWTRVGTNLAADRLRLVFVADVIPSSLAQIVEYLNRRMSETEVLAIEVRQFRDDAGTQQIVVPRVVGQTEQARAAKGQGSVGQWDRDTILSRTAERSGEARAQVVRRLFEWFDGRGDLDETFGKGTKDGSWQAGYWESSRYIWPFVVYTYGRVEIEFQHIAKRSPFDDLALRTALRDKLLAIKDVTLPDDAVDRRPSIDLNVLSDASSFTEFTATLDWIYNEANNREAD